MTVSAGFTARRARRARRGRAVSWPFRRRSATDRWRRPARARANRVAGGDSYPSQYDHRDVRRTRSQQPPRGARARGRWRDTGHDSALSRATDRRQRGNAITRKAHCYRSRYRRSCLARSLCVHSHVTHSLRTGPARPVPGGPEAGERPWERQTLRDTDRPRRSPWRARSAGKMEARCEAVAVVRSIDEARSDDRVAGRHTMTALR